MIRFIAIALSVFLCSTGFAQNELTIQLINDSTATFVFEKTVVEFPHNRFSINKKHVFPGETAIIRGTTTYTEDLSGVLVFNGDAKFWIVDKRQVHIGPPIFAFASPTVVSKTVTRTQNPQVGARLLSYVAATVRVQDLQTP